jgi:hypothetical protein
MDIWHHASSLLASCLSAESIAVYTRYRVKGRFRKLFLRLPRQCGSRGGRNRHPDPRAS